MSQQFASLCSRFNDIPQKPNKPLEIIQMHGDYSKYKLES